MSTNKANKMAAQHVIQSNINLPHPLRRRHREYRTALPPRAQQYDVAPAPNTRAGGARAAGPPAAHGRPCAHGHGHGGGQLYGETPRNRAVALHPCRRPQGT